MSKNNYSLFNILYETDSYKYKGVNKSKKTSGSCDLKGNIINPKIQNIIFVKDGDNSSLKYIC